MRGELPKNVKDVLDKWFNGYKYTIHHFWEIREYKTFHVVLVDEGNTLTCARLWESVFTGNIEISIDNSVDL